MASDHEPLTDLHRAVIEFERLRWKYQGRREAAILELFEMTATRFAQILASLLDHPEAERFDPTTIRRLRRLRDARKSERTRRA